ncbi:hypothetical protein L9F63_010118, partial [Diploptera punctata]
FEGLAYRPTNKGLFNLPQKFTFGDFLSKSINLRTAILLTPSSKLPLFRKISPGMPITIVGFIPIPFLCFSFSIFPYGVSGYGVYVGDYRSNIAY